MMWTPKRLPGKNLACAITFGDVRGVPFATINSADSPIGEPCSWVIQSTYKPVAKAGDVRLNIITVEDTKRWAPDTELPDHWRVMKVGVKSGLSEDPATLAGKHVLHQAISLAVHLGFSRIHLQVPSPDPRLRRALDSLVRPLRHKRVHVTGCAPFPEE